MYRMFRYVSDTLRLRPWKRHEYIYFIYKYKQFKLEMSLVSELNS